LEKMCWLRREVRWRLTCAIKCLVIMVEKKKSVPVIFKPPCNQSDFKTGELNIQTSEPKLGQSCDMLTI
jgi:hypothetical protein